MTAGQLLRVPRIDYSGGLSIVEPQFYRARKWWATAPAALLDSGDGDVADLVAAFDDHRPLTCGGMWQALAVNPNLDASWWAQHGLVLSTYAVDPVQALDLLGRALEPRLAGDPVLVSALLAALAQGSVDTPHSDTGLPDPQEWFGVASRDWGILVGYVLFGESSAAWNGSGFDLQRLVVSQGCEDFRSTWGAVMATYRSGLLLGRLDTPTSGLTEAVVQEIKSWIPLLVGCSRAHRWPQMISVALLNDAAWPAGSPGPGWVFTEAGRVLAEHGADPRLAAPIVEELSLALPDGSNLADLVAAVRDVIAAPRPAIGLVAGASSPPQ